VKRFTLCYQTVVLSVCLSETLVYCGQTVGWIKMKLGMQVGLDPRHNVLDEDPSPPPPKGHSPQFSAHICCGQMAGWIKMPLGMDFPKRVRSPPPPIFGPCLLWPNGWMDQDDIWYGGGPQSRPHCARWRPSSPLQKGDRDPIFGPFLLWPNDCMYQDTTWYRGRPQPRRHCVKWGPSSPSRKEHSPQFSANVRCGQTAA